MKASTLRRGINLWPPFFFSGIRVTQLSEDYREAEVTLSQHWYNRNYVGTHFGGSLFAMTDALYMIMLLHVLGTDYYVWDRHAAIDYLKPGRGTVTVRFRLDDAMLAEIHSQTAGGEKYLPKFTLNITDAAGEIVARVKKTLYVRKKPHKR